MMRKRRRSKHHRQKELDEDECELQPERRSQHAVLAMFDSQTLVFPTDEDGGDEVARNEEQEKDVVQLGVSARVEDGE